MDIKIIKKKDGRVDRNTGLLITERLRVTAYARVSTGNEEQLNSYESQKNIIKKKYLQMMNGNISICMQMKQFQELWIIKETIL